MDAIISLILQIKKKIKNNNNKKTEAQAPKPNKLQR